jgi:hypothetical protein
VTATNNGTNGVEVQATCTNVFLINGTYTGNGQYGLSILNGALSQSGAPVFANNGAGNIFQDPGTCVFATTPPPAAPPTTPPTNPPTAPVNNPVNTGTDTGTNTETSTSAQGVNSLARTVRNSNVGGSSLFRSSTGGAWTTGNTVTLNGLLANSTLANSTIHTLLFTGEYIYVYSDDGLLIIALSPNSLDGLAMGES